MPRRRLKTKRRTTEFPTWDELGKLTQLLIRSDSPDNPLLGFGFTPRQWLESDPGRAYLADFIEQNPGKRPHLWWKTTALQAKYRLFRVSKGPKLIETDAAYLMRLELLTSLEVEMFEAGDLPARRPISNPAAILSNGFTADGTDYAKYGRSGPSESKEG